MNLADDGWVIILSLDYLNSIIGGREINLTEQILKYRGVFFLVRAAVGGVEQSEKKNFFEGFSEKFWKNLLI